MSKPDQEKAPNHWARISERGAYTGLRFMLWTYQLLGRKVFSLLLYPVMAYFFVFGVEARRASQDFLSRIYQDSRGRGVLGRAPGWRHSYRHFLNFGEAILDKLAAWTEEIQPDNIVYENREVFEALQSNGRGGLLIASHLGNMEVCRALGQLSLGLKLNVLVHTKHAPNFNRLLKRVSPQSNVSLIQTTEVDPGTAMLLQDRIGRGEIVVIVGDRTPVTKSNRTSWANFIGQPAPFPQGPYLLAGLLKCPVQLIFCLKRQGQYHIIFEPFADSIKLSRKSRFKDLDEWTKRYVTRLEHFCVYDPYQWFNFFDFWNQAGTMPPENKSNHR